MSSTPLLDAAGRRRSPAAMPGHNAGQSPTNKGQSYPADPPTVDEIVAVMRQTTADRHGLRLRALIVVLWRGGLRIQEALSLIESDLDARRGSVLIRKGKGNRRREVGLDAWVLERPSRSLGRVPGRVADRRAVLRDRRTDSRPALVGHRSACGVAPLRARSWCPAQVCAASAEACSCGRTRREGVPLPVIQRQLGHSYVSTTSVYLQGIDIEEIIGTIHARRAPMMHVSAGLEL